MNKALWKWRVQLRLELRLLFGSWIWMSLPALFGLWFAYTLAAPGENLDLFSASYDFNRLQHVLSIGIAMLLGLLLLRRDMMNPAYEWFRSQPIATRTLIGAKYAAGLLYLTLFTVARSGIFWLFGHAAGVETDNLLKSIGADFLQYTCTYAVTLALSMLLAADIRGRSVYLIGFCAWMFGTLFMEMFIITPSSRFFMKTFHLSQYFIDITPSWNEVWGSYLDREALFSRLFVAGFALMLLAVTSAVLGHFRPSAGAVRARWLAGAAVLAAVMLFLPYAMLWSQRYGEYQTRLAEAPQNKPEATLFAVDSYDICLTRGRGNKLAASVAIRFSGQALSDSEPVFLTLHRAFAPLRVSLNGHDVRWERQGDWIIVHPGGQQPGDQELVVDYKGSPQEWMPSLNRGEAKPMFVDGESLYLPGYLAWYPLPGKQALYFKDDGYSQGTALENRSSGLSGPAEFKLTLQNFRHKVYATLPQVHEEPGRQIHADSKAEGVTLVSGRFTEVRAAESDTLLVTGVAQAEQSKRFLQAYARIMAYFNSWLREPAPGLHTLFYLPLERVSIWNLSELEQMMGGAFFINQYHSAMMYSYSLSDAVNAALFGDRNFRYVYSGSLELSPVTAEIRFAFFRLYYAEHPEDDPNNNESFVQFQPYFRYPAEGDASISEDVERALEEGRLDQLKRVLNDFYDSGLGIGKNGDYPAYTHEDWLRAWEINET